VGRKVQADVSLVVEDRLCLLCLYRRNHIGSHENTILDGRGRVSYSRQDHYHCGKPVALEHRARLHREDYHAGHQRGKQDSHEIVNHDLHDVEP
jgi:hypothetical protein